MRAVRSLLIGMALFAPAAAAADGGNRPGLPAAAEAVVYQRGAPDQSQIWFRFGDGSGARQVSYPPDGASDSLPTLGLANATVAWERRQGEGPTQIVLGSWGDTKTVVMTAATSGAFQPGLSRDGTLVWSQHEGADCTLWVLRDANAALYRGPQPPTQLTAHPGAPACDSDPVWSGDGTQIVFRRTLLDANGAATSSSLMTVPADGGTPTPFGLDAASVQSLAWSPAPRLLTLGTGAAPQLAAVEPDGSHRRVLATGAQLVGPPAWAPLGAYLAVAELQSDRTTDIVRRDADGGGATDLTNSPGVDESAPSWGYYLPRAVLAGSVQGGRAAFSGAHSAKPSAHRRRRRRRHRRHGRAVIAGADRWWLGTTDQRPWRYGPQQLPNSQVWFRVAGGEVRDFAIPWAVPCGPPWPPGTPVIDRSVLAPMKLANGRFSAHGVRYQTQPGPAQVASVRLDVEGVVHGGRARGTLSIHVGLRLEDVYDAGGCPGSPDDAQIAWKASRD